MNPRTHAEAALIPWPDLARLESARAKAHSGGRWDFGSTEFARKSRIAERRDRIVAMITEPRTKSDIAATLTVSPYSIDADLAVLAKAGKVRRAGAKWVAV